LRALRDGLNLLGLNSNDLLRHGQRRCIYGVALAFNLTEYLLGFERTPKYYFSEKQIDASVSSIAHWWWEHWAKKRIEKAEVLMSMQTHTLVHPIRHGARVMLPSDEIDQFSLFSEVDA
jgi:hypothetical protein